MSEKYAFTMSRVSKTYAPSRTVLSDINLCFFHGAKIGVLGLNGAGKSTLLRIMAGVEKDFAGEARPAEGLRIGYLPQEPRLDDSLTVRASVLEGLGATTALLRRFEEISESLGKPDLDADAMQALLDEQASVQEQIEAADGWELDHTLEVAMQALHLPPPDESVAHLSGGEKRRVAICR